MPGDVVVLRGLGVRGGPGMGMASRVVFAIDGAGLGPHVAFVTDGQLSGLVNKGLVVGEVTPEAATGGPLALVVDGDPITIDADAGTIELLRPRGRARGAARKAQAHRPALGRRLARDLRALGAAAQQGRGAGAPEKLVTP